MVLRGVFYYFMVKFLAHIENIVLHYFQANNIILKGIPIDIVRLLFLP